MRSTDVLGLALSALGRHKVRTILTTVGVLVAVFLMISSVSVGRGVYEATMRQFRKGGSLRQIQVAANYLPPERYIPEAELAIHGTMSDAKRGRLRERLVRDYNRLHMHGPQVRLTPERLRQLASLEHVARVQPYLVHSGRATYQHQPPRRVLAAASPANDVLSPRLMAGDLLTSDDGTSVVVSEYLLYRWGLVGDGDVRQALGKKIRLEYRTAGPTTPLPGLLSLLSGPRLQLAPEEKRLLERTARYLPEARQALHLDDQEVTRLQRILGRLPAQAPRGRTEMAEFTIVGVVREVEKDDDFTLAGIATVPNDAELYLPVRTAQDFFLRASRPEDNTVSVALVEVDDEANLRSVIDQVKALGLKQWSLLKFADRVKLNLTLILFAVSFLATVALLVSALGITNTMFMSVLERTREIGIMKAVGARNLHIQAIFLIEGALIGATGGALGLLLSWLVSFPGNSVARSLMERQTGAHLHESLFVLPLWLIVGVPLFATIVTTLAALYPARRAAAVNPITALRYE